MPNVVAKPSGVSDKEQLRARAKQLKLWLLLMVAVQQVGPSPYFSRRDGE